MISVKSASTASFVVTYRSAQENVLYYPCNSDPHATLNAVIPGPTGCIGTEYFIKNYTGANTVLVSCTCGTIDGNNGCILAATKWLHVVSSGAKWLVVDTNGVLFG